MSSLTVAVAQFSSGIGRIEENLAAITRLASEAAKREAKLVLFAEDCVTGYPSDAAGAAGVALEQGSAAWRTICELSQRLQIVIAAGLIEKIDAATFHSSH